LPSQGKKSCTVFSNFDVQIHLSINVIGRAKSKRSVPANLCRKDAPVTKREQMDMPDVIQPSSLGTAIHLVRRTYTSSEN
jgi:hypothetical protein